MPTRRVTLRDGGHVVHEDIDCETRADAERIASARWPGYKVIGFNAIWEEPDVDLDSSAGKYVSDTSSGGGSFDFSSISFGGQLILVIAIICLWLAVEYWYIFWPVVILGGVLYIFGSAED